eukprot:Hpha_TRINITY_DN15882_c0_g1::TRINITY_DN15882_c0_g1_i1::g.189202::m.189202
MGGGRVRTGGAKWLAFLGYFLCSVLTPRGPRAVVEGGEGIGVHDVKLGGVVTVQDVAVVVLKTGLEVDGEVDESSCEVVALLRVRSKVEEPQGRVLWGGDVLVGGVGGPVTVGNAMGAHNDLHVAPNECGEVLSVVVHVKGDLPVRLRRLLSEQCCPHVLPVPVLLHSHTSAACEGRHHVDSVHQPREAGAAELGRQEPTHHPRRPPHPALVNSHLAAPQRPIRRDTGGEGGLPLRHPAVVGGDEDQTVVPHALLLQQLHEVTHGLVEVTHHRAERLTVHGRGGVVLGQPTAGLGVLLLRGVLDGDVDLLVGVVQEERLVLRETVDDLLHAPLVVRHRVCARQRPSGFEVPRCVVPEVEALEQSIRLEDVRVVVHLSLQVPGPGLEPPPNRCVIPS